ncbi:MAG: uncharacterized protein QOF30_1115 [Acidimicrobiaceae bacterium]|jgi:pimeloyl-ACP methyl ester carboxylesterase|nr:uncharacterized protein [Acidimicrobiaceae bacterium]
MAAIALSAALLITVIGGAWYATSRVTTVTHVQDCFPLRVVDVNPVAGTVTIGRGPDATEPGTFRLAWPDGQAVVGAVVSVHPTTITRRLSGLRGQLKVGQSVGIEPNAYVGDPASAVGLEYSTVTVPTPLGAMPAWMIPGRRATWVVLVHGLGGSRSDTLAAMPALHTLGYPILAISYRNDLGVPASSDHRSHIGATEWRDVQSAVVYAMGHGASGVVLYGYSLGGAMALLVARDPATRPDVRALILDSPVLDWLATLDYQARRHELPRALVAVGEQLLAWRIHLNYSQFDQLSHEAALGAPVLLIQGDADTVVPPALATRFARARPSLVTYLFVPGADHVSAIDAAPFGYRDALAAFLARYP